MLIREIDFQAQAARLTGHYTDSNPAGGCVCIHDGAQAAQSDHDSDPISHIVSSGLVGSFRRLWRIPFRLASPSSPHPAKFLSTFTAQKGRLSPGLELPLQPSSPMFPTTMRTADFEFDLPEHLIAQHPAQQRDESRMLVIDRAAGSLAHATVQDLPDLLSDGDCLVTNNTKVIPARIHGYKESGGAVECLFVEPVEDAENEWLVMMKSSRRPKPGARISLGSDCSIELLANRSDGLNRIRVSGPADVVAYLNEHGEPPLPPYIQREKLAEDDPERYQTVFAEIPGAVAAPTAGLHFTPALLDTIRGRGVDTVELTLHVGPGTFRPVKVDTVEDHKMDAERYIVPRETAELLNAARARGGRITAVGSTCTRTLETNRLLHEHFTADSGRSDLFIYPPFNFKAVDQLLTNFHLPASTLIMMVCAFAGRELTMAAYEEAIRHEYRFYSYGDCMFIR